MKEKNIFNSLFVYLRRRVTEGPLRTFFTHNLMGSELLKMVLVYILHILILFRGKDELQGVPVSELIYIHSKLIIVDDNRNFYL